MTFRNILVDIDALAPFHPALEQAVDLARRAGARVTIVDVVEDVPKAARGYISERLEGEILERRRERLSEAVAPHVSAGVSIAATVLRGRPALTLIRQVIEGGHDLLVRYHARDLFEKRAGFDAVDMQLLRKCPCPVWLVGVGERTRPRRILAAIHPERQEETDESLNGRIVAAAAEMARLEKGSFVLVTCWMPFGAGLLEGRLSEAEHRKFVNAARRTAAADLDAFVASLGEAAAGSETALVKGEPETAIPRYVKRHDIDLVVMGTVARTGIMGFIMGNTAERVLRQLKCSVLALKPAGFKSPIER